MSAGITIIKPLDIAAVAVTDGTGAANLLSPSTREVWRASVVGLSNIDLDFGTVVTLDTIFLGFSNAGPNAVWTVASMASPAGAALNVLTAARPLRSAQPVGDRHHGYIRLAAPVSTRYLRLSVNQIGTAQPFHAGIVIAGLAIERAYEYRAGRGAIDLANKTELQDGGFGISRSAIVSSYRFTLAGLTDDQVDELWQIVMDIGESAPVLIVEGHTPPVKHAQLHYGLLDRLEPYEREDPQDSRWGLSVRDWG